MEKKTPTKKHEYQQYSTLVLYTLKGTNNNCPCADIYEPDCKSWI